MKYLYYNREEVDSFEKCTHPSGCETNIPALEVCFSDDQEFMIDFIKRFREKVNRAIEVIAYFNNKNSGPDGENSYIEILIHNENDWKLAFTSIDEVIEDYNACVDEIIIENY